MGHNYWNEASCKFSSNQKRGLRNRYKVSNTRKSIKERKFGSEDNTTINQKVNMFDTIKYYHQRKSFLHAFSTHKDECNMRLLFTFFDQKFELVKPMMIEVNKAEHFYVCLNN